MLQAWSEAAAVVILFIVASVQRARAGFYPVIVLKSVVAVPPALRHQACLMAADDWPAYAAAAAFLHVRETLAQALPIEGSWSTLDSCGAGAFASLVSLEAVRRIAAGAEPKA